MRILSYNQIQNIADDFNRIMFVQQNEKMNLKKLSMLTSSIGGKARLVDASKKDESSSEISWKEGIFKTDEPWLVAKGGEWVLRNFVINIDSNRDEESISFVLATFIGYVYIYLKNDLASRQLFNELKVREDVLGEDDIPPNSIEACEVFATCLLKNDLYV